MIISAVLFDFDGTLTEPNAIDFGAVREELGCPATEPVLEFIDAMQDNESRRRAGHVLDRYEMEAASNAVPNDGAEQTVRTLRRLGVPLAILTRNSDMAIRRSLRNFRGIDERDFDLIVTRDHDLPPKPDPDGIEHVAEVLRVPAGELLCVGDYVFDIQSANRAGSPSALLTNGSAVEMPAGIEPDFVVRGVAEIIAIVQRHRRLACGKLPGPLLAELLTEFRMPSPELIVAPGLGEDCAVVRPEPNRWLALKSDPITFASDQIGVYAVTVNANDLAASGALPRWFLATILMPPGVCAEDVRQIMRQLHQAAAAQGIVLCGGHTEITDSVTRPVVSGHLIGEITPAGRIDTKAVTPGDRVLLTKRVAVEGTAVIAREMPERLRSYGMDASLIERSQAFLENPGIGVVAEARTALQAGGVHAMHDVTEGGLVTALDELSFAVGYGLEIDLDRIPVYNETQQLCRAVGIEPLGLIGSGSLLIVCDMAANQTILDAVHRIGIEATTIGVVRDAPPGVEATQSGRAADWPHFEVDEIARLFATER